MRAYRLPVRHKKDEDDARSMVILGLLVEMSVQSARVIVRLEAGKAQHVGKKRLRHLSANSFSLGKQRRLLAASNGPFAPQDPGRAERT